MRELVKLRTRPSRDGRRFIYRLDYVGNDGKRRRISLGHCDRRKAERQRAETERHLRAGVLGPPAKRLSEFLEDSLIRTGSQIRESTVTETRIAFKQFIEVVGDMNYQRVSLGDAEKFRQFCLDAGNAPATVSKKLRHIQRVFQLAVKRRQLSENPFNGLDMPKSPRRKVNTFSVEQCVRILTAARDFKNSVGLNWELLILMALTTGMRRGELLNCTWGDIDFEKMMVTVAPKMQTVETWEWHVKDMERRVLPLTEVVISMLSAHQVSQPEKLPYVFVPAERYVKIQQLRKEGKWGFSDSRLSVVRNFDRQFRYVLRRAGLQGSRFHDLRRTALSNWLRDGLSMWDVMTLAGHSSISTTERFYLATSHDLTDRARQTACRKLAHFWHAPSIVGAED
jgi:integrase